MSPPEIKPGSYRVSHLCPTCGAEIKDFSMKADQSKPNEGKNATPPSWKMSCLNGHAFSNDNCPNGIPFQTGLVFTEKPTPKS